MFQGGTIIRAARRMAEKVGYDLETGRHLDEAPQFKQEDPTLLEDGESDRNCLRDHLKILMYRTARNRCH